MKLKEHIVERIKGSGPLPFEAFMAIALYHEEGFFGGQTLRSAKGGDFLTSPEVSALFGETLAEFVRAERDRIGEPFQVVEVASGSGSLLEPLLEMSGWPPATAIEVSPASRAAIAQRLPRVVVAAQTPADIRGVVIANELLDNLPMALAQKTDAGWRERWVGLGEVDEQLHFVDAPVRPEVLDWLNRYAGEVPEGGWVEVQMEAASWLTDTIRRLDAGAIVLIDYGDTAENLVPRRTDGTLRTYRAHHLGPHPLDEPGETDITADVNFTALVDIATKLGAEVSLMRQDDFLGELGLRDRLSELRQAELEAARGDDAIERLRLRTLKTEAETLMHPRGLGDFRVLVVRR